MNDDLTPLSYASTQSYLVGLKSRGVSLGLERMRVFAAALGNPQTAVPCVHVAGTNGKGSVAAMLESIFREAGWRTGLYTSPHLIKLGERIQVNRQILSEREIAVYTGELRRAAEAGAPEAHPSYFEFMTAMAFLHFERQRCDIAIIEVGLGGRLDATNIVVPEVSVITSIGLDHCEFLGHSLEAIATEKAGIIKSKRPVIVGNMPAVAQRVIRETAIARGSRVYSVEEEFGNELKHYPSTNLEGDYQRRNAGTATLVTREISPKWRLSEASVIRALRQVTWPGRWERVHLGRRLIVLDASHNPEGASVLDANLRKLQAEQGRAPVVIVGVLGAARAKPLIATICRYALEIYLVVPGQARACSHAELEALVPPSFSGRTVRATVEDLFPSRTVCTVGDAHTAVVVTGSIYLLSEVLGRLHPEQGPIENRLQDF